MGKMVRGLRGVASWICFICGGLILLLAIFGPASSAEGTDPRLVIGVIGGLLIAAGAGFRAKNKERPNPLGSDYYAPFGVVVTGKPGEYTTKRCPACCETIPLSAQFCEYCGKKQREGDSTCSGNESLTVAQARSSFASERANAKKLGSTQYIWRSIRDGARCERCANNDGHVFSWDEEPPGGHAGAKARCRCYPEAIIPKSR